MSALLVCVFKATVGFIVNKSRDAAAEKLKDGDVTNQRLRDLITRELSEVKSKLDGLARKDLLAAIDFFQEGIILLHKVLRSNITQPDNGITDAIRKLEVISLNESSKELLSNAKKRFEDARRKATEAFNDEGLKPSDRVSAMEYRMMATVLEAADNPSTVSSACKMCIERLNSHPVVENCFTFEVKKRFRGLFSKQERREMVSETCRLNRMIYDIIVMTQGFGDKEVQEILQSWPRIQLDGGNDSVNPLVDPRVSKCLCKIGQKHSCLLWTFGQKGEKEQTLKEPWGITTNTLGQFIVADYKDGNVKVFDNHGNFLSLFRPVSEGKTGTVFVHDVATDQSDNMYVLVSIEDDRSKEVKSYVYLKTPNSMIPLKEDLMWSWTWSSLAISDKGKIFVRGVLAGGHHVVDMYKTDGKFVRRFGERELKVSSAVAATCGGGVAVATGGRDSYYINFFNRKGKRDGQFQVDKSFHFPQMTYHQASRCIVVAGVHVESIHLNRLEIVILTEEGEFVRNIEYKEENLMYLRGITVTIDGIIALVCSDKMGFKVLVV